MDYPMKRMIPAGVALALVLAGCHRQKAPKNGQAPPPAQAVVAPQAAKPAEVDLPSLSTAAFILAGFDRTPPRDPRSQTADAPLNNYLAYLLSAKPEAQGPVFRALDQEPDFHEVIGKIAPVLASNQSKDAKDAQIRALVAPVARKLSREQGADLARKVAAAVLAGSPRNVWVSYPFKVNVNWEPSKGALWLGIDDSGHRWGRSAPCRKNYESLERDALEHAIVSGTGSFVDHVSAIFLEDLWIKADPPVVDQITQTAKEKGLKVAFMNLTGFWKAEKLALLNASTNEVILEVTPEALYPAPKRASSPAVFTF